MRCQTCDYSLWNLARRDCPECGSAFKPSDFEFQPNAVQYCCPHCEQVYYGDGPMGHLRPFEFDCVKCGQHVAMDQMVLRPAEGFGDGNSLITTNPWLNRNNEGMTNGWIKAVGLALAAPSRLIKGTPVQRDTGQAVRFSLMTLAFYMLIGYGAALVFQIAFLAIGTTPGGGGVELLAVVAFALIGLLVALVFYLLVILLWAGITHSILHLTGSTQAGFHRTLQAICYSSACNCLMAIPCLGMYLQPFSWIWWMVSATLMVKEGQKVSGLRACMATLLPPGILVGSLAILITIGIMAIYNSMTAMNAALVTPTVQEAEVQQALDAVETYRLNHVAWPDHVAQCVVDPAIAFAPSQGGTGISMTFHANVPVGDRKLAHLIAGDDPQANAAAVEAAAQALPDDVVAHRLADLVFTYHGVDPESNDGDLWLVVYWPDPDFNQPIPAGTARPGTRSMPWPWQFSVGEADGDITHYSVFNVQAELDNQNALREAEGLAPLPLPATVLHGQPATAEGAGAIVE